MHTKLQNLLDSVKGDVSVTLEVNIGHLSPEVGRGCQNLPRREAEHSQVRRKEQRSVDDAVWQKEAEYAAAAAFRLGRGREKKIPSYLSAYFISHGLVPPSPPKLSTQVPHFLPKQQILPPHHPSTIPSPTPPPAALTPPSINSAPPSKPVAYPYLSD